MEASPSVFQIVCVKMEKPLSDLFASRVSHQLPTYVAWRKDPYSVATNAFSITWNKEFYYEFPPFLPNNTGSKQDKKGKDKKINFDNTMLVDRAVVPPNTEHVDKETSNPSIIRKTTNHWNQSFRADLRSCNKSNPYISGMDGFRGHLLEKVANLISNSRRQSSLSGYESSWKNWSGWWDRNTDDTFRCTSVSILDYLTALFEEGLEYNTIGVHRSAISTYHETVDDVCGPSSFSYFSNGRNI